MSTDKKVLDLDELFGEARAIKIKWGGKEYELLRMEALSPRSISRFQGLQRRTHALQSEVTGGGELSEESNQEIMRMFDEMLMMLCESFPVNTMPFAYKAKVLEFYIEETQPKNAVDAALEMMKKQTGAASIQG